MFPFFLVAAAVLAIAAGSKSGWRTQADMAAGEAPLPSIQGSGIKSWFCWVLVTNGGAPRTAGPYYVTDVEALGLELPVRSGMTSVDTLHRFARVNGKWERDSRSFGELKSLSPTVGAYPVTPPKTGKWTFKTFPDVVTVNGKKFKKALWQFPRSNVIAQYREDVLHDSTHLFVMKDGTFLIDHVDESNPDKGLVMEHLVNDVLLRHSGMGLGFKDLKAELKRKMEPV